MEPDSEIRSGFLIPEMNRSLLDFLARLPDAGQDNAQFSDASFEEAMRAICSSTDPQPPPASTASKNEVELLVTERGAQKILHRGNLFWKQHSLKNGNVRYRCQRHKGKDGKCPAKITVQESKTVTFEEGQHNHSSTEPAITQQMRDHTVIAQGSGTTPFRIMAKEEGMPRSRSNYLKYRRTKNNNSNL